MITLGKTFKKKVEELLVRAQFIKTILDDGVPDVFIGFADEEKQQRYALTRQQQRAFVERIERAIGCLAPVEQELITKRYMQCDSEYVRDYQVYAEMQICEGTFMKYRKRAFLKLAELLGIQHQIDLGANGT
ncbi:ArpU family phage packaging/lysis transcriptional regulator [Paenibacillus sp. MBLB4367]|uniref:ArpU family phage packaging/lysis transcriptional regulator n=1 Tax=Paenibacillus sp. MBLB4367 TaxID=3384767 RepID=UPI0039084446